LGGTGYRGIHSQISMTMNTYSHVIPELRRSAADKMDDLLNER